MIGLLFLRRTLAAGGIPALAWPLMGAASPNVTAPGLTVSAPQFTVHRLDKGVRLAMARAPAVRHFPPNWHWR